MAAKEFPPKTYKKYFVQEHRRWVGTYYTVESNASYEGILLGSGLHFPTRRAAQDKADRLNNSKEASRG